MRNRVLCEHRESLAVLDGPEGIQAVLSDLLSHRGRGEVVRAVVGRALVPVTQAARRPGLHLVQRPVAQTDGGEERPFTLTAELWPVYGPLASQRSRVDESCASWHAGDDPMVLVRARLGCPAHRW